MHTAVLGNGLEKDGRVSRSSPRSLVGAMMRMMAIRRACLRAGDLIFCLARGALCIKDKTKGKGQGRRCRTVPRKFVIPVRLRKRGNIRLYKEKCRSDAPGLVLIAISALSAFVLIIHPVMRSS